MKTKPIVLIFLLAALLALAACSPAASVTNAATTVSTGTASAGTTAGKTGDGALVVGMELQYPPFEMTDAQNKPAGISVDLAEAIGKHLGRPVRIENMAFSGLIPALISNKIDLIISSMTINDERKKTIDFSDPYAQAVLALLINKDSPVQQYEDLKQPGRKLAVKEGTTGHIYARDHLPEANIVVFKDMATAVTEVVQGKVDATTYDQFSIYEFWKQNEAKTRMNLNRYQDQGGSKEYWGVGLRQNSPLKEPVNEAIRAFRESGGFDQATDKYLKEVKAKFDEMKIPFFFDLDAP